MWEQAKEIARDTLDGKLWLPEIGKSTHYHAYWVHPSWVARDAASCTRSACTRFYRPRAWGDGAEVPTLGRRACRRRRERRRSCSAHISISSPTSRLGAEWVSAPDEA